MRDRAQDAMQMEKKKRDFLEAGFRLFSEKGIEAVTLPMVAEACGYGTATLYRYFDKKPGFVVAVAAWTWGGMIEERRKLRDSMDFAEMTALEAYENFLNSFIDTYRNRRDLLRFNQFFNIYAFSEKIPESDMSPYQEVVDFLRELFFSIYEKAERDHTLRTDFSAEQMFSVSIHLMLAAVTRFAVGLIYYPKEGFDPIGELEIQKEMLVEKFKSTGGETLSDED